MRKIYCQSSGSTTNAGHIGTKGDIMFIFVRRNIYFKRIRPMEEDRSV